MTLTSRSLKSLALVFVLLLSGCATIDFQALNDRNVRSCWKYSGAYGLFVGMHGVTLTGDMTIDDCVKLLKGD